jgi:hypothetical protein
MCDVKVFEHFYPLVCTAKTNATISTVPWIKYWQKSITTNVKKEWTQSL